MAAVVTPLDPIFASRRQRLGDYFMAVQSNGNGTVTGFVEPLACALARVLFEGDGFDAAPDLRDFLGMDQAEYIWVFIEGCQTVPDCITPGFVAGKLLKSIDFTQTGIKRSQPRRNSNGN